MLTIKPGEHGSTFGGNPLACRVAIAAMNVVIDEDLAEKAQYLGNIFREQIEAINSPLIEQIRGKGLLNAIVIRHDSQTTAWDICIEMKEQGILAKPTHGHIIRFAPPLVITEAQLTDAVNRIKQSFYKFS
jgi:ornithine--oxo-acid transaminase